MSWSQKRTSSWKEGDTIINATTGKRCVIKTITRRSSFDVIRTTNGRNIIDDSIELWDLELPALDFTAGEKKRK